MSSSNVDVRDRPDVVNRLPSLAVQPAHVSLADRASMRLGLWLLVRSAEHAQHRADPEAHALRVRNERSREARELAFERERPLWLSR